MTDEEYATLVADIKANGLQNEIILYDGMILDGRHRYLACLAAGVPPVTLYGNGWITDPAAYVISVNFQRRHLTAKQKRDALVKFVATRPEKSDRELARNAKVDHKQISRARKKAEATGAIAPVEKRVGKDGKVRKARAKKARPAKKLTLAEHRRAVREDLARYRAQADQVVAILLERLGRDALMLVRDAAEALDGIETGLAGAIERQLKVEQRDTFFNEEDFLAKYGKPEPAAPDDGLDIPECLRRTPMKAAVS
jgi:hypothetical protein